ncbi:hypothetical protein JTB14_013300 [Gonioctena quinquepunctata]|nr:hypothetical protein JTB14_013300 [Gonioctena quinquepunctata]
MNYMVRKLDLVLVNVETECYRCEQPVVTEDRYHPALCLFVQTRAQAYQNDYLQPSHVYDYAKGDFHLLYSLMGEINWDPVEGTNNVDTALEKFYEKMLSCIDQAIPKKRLNPNKKRCEYPSYFSIDLIRKIKKKNLLLRKLKRGKDSVAQCDEYRIIRGEVKNQTKREYEHYLQSIEHNVNDDPSSFWSYIRSKTTTSAISSEMQYNDNVYSEPEDIAFAQFFSSVYNSPTSPDLLTGCGNFNFANITEETVRLNIKKLKP